MIDEKISWAATERNSKFGNQKQAGKVLLGVISDLMAELEAAKAPAKKAPAKKAPAKKAPAKKSTKRKTTTKK